MRVKKKITLVMMTMVVTSALFVGCGKDQSVKGTIAGFEGLTIQVNSDDGNTYDFEIADDTILDADHQPEEGDPIEVQYKEENGKNIAVKAVVRCE